MGKFNFSDEEKNRWFQFDIDTEVQIKLITKRDLREIARKAAKRAKLTGEDEGDIADRLLGRAAVMGWRKMDDHNHPGIIVNDQPCTFCPENIDVLITRSIKFSRFVNQMCIDEDEFLEETETKNAL
ncbi:MAG: hypothetical protein C4538_10515 [Nitrospiraceae bacterium]|nr:MAG: hypothetical protein C4538_10515 [Nitrospiraceae bacterium]